MYPLRRQLLKELAKVANWAGAALVGGETAEMPGMYTEGDYDLAGFCVGIVEKAKIIDGSQVEAGDKLIGIASSGPHSNGYSLIRKILNRSGTSLSDTFNASTLGQALLEPTRIYVQITVGLAGRSPRPCHGPHHRWRHHRKPCRES